jgi:hypothetical protein
MIDLQFDPVLRDIVIYNGDFMEIPNASMQNGAIIRDAKCFSILNPVFGVGLQGAINAPLADVNYLMGHWKQQVKSDGASQASFTAQIINNTTIINTKIAY